MSKKQKPTKPPTKRSKGTPFAVMQKGGFSRWNNLWDIVVHGVVDPITDGYPREAAKLIVQGLNLAFEAAHVERCAACPAKQAQDAMVRFKELLGNRSAPVPPSAKNLEAAQKRILSTLNAAERRIVEARYGIPSNVDTSAGVPVTDEMEIGGTLVHPAYGGMTKASDAYPKRGAKPKAHKRGRK